MPKAFDAVVVGSGPNGLSAAIELARNGISVCIFEAFDEIGGGTRSAELTQPGFLHDICSAIHPFAGVSPFFRSLALRELGVQWVHPPAALAHPFEDGSAAVVSRSIERTCDSLGVDGEAYAHLFRPFLHEPFALFDEVLRPVRLPRKPLLLARFGRLAVQSCGGLARRIFRGSRARAVFAGCSAHSAAPLEFAGTAAFGLTLLLAAHAFGWPCVRGGSREIAQALSGCLGSLNVPINTGRRIRSLEELPASRAVLFDLPPKLVVEIAGEHLPRQFAERLMRFRHGPGVSKVDWALEGPIPWKSPECLTAATVHLGGTFEEIAASEADVWSGRHAARPFILVAQQSLFDPSRAPAGKHTAWAYCHTPNGSSIDATPAIEDQMERFAPGFRTRVLARHSFTAAQIEEHNPAMIGGDIGGGANNLWNLLGRPVFRWNPYTTPNKRIYLCGSSTPPGGGVHGMCGYWSARAALRRSFS